MVGTLWYTLKVPSISARTVMFSVVLSVFQVYVAVVAWLAPRGPMRGTQRLIALLLMMQVLASALNGMGSLRTQFTSVFLTTPAQTLFLLVTISVTFCQTLLLAILTSQHMNALLTATLDNLNQGVAMFNADQKLIICNDRYSLIYGLDPEQMKAGTSLRTVVKWRIENGLFAGASAAEYFRDQTLPVQAPSMARQQLNDGRNIAISLIPLTGGGLLATHEDVTDLHRIEAQLAYLAHHDSLTGLVNRVVFMENMAEGLARMRADGEEFCVVLLDLDRFKAVNDSFGHPVGDALLEAVASRLQSCTLPNDTVARLGGDEFAVIRFDIGGGRDTLADLASGLVRCVAAPYDLEGRKVTIGTSIGIALAPQDGADAELLMQKADLALYRAKSEGRNRYRFYMPDMDADARTRSAVESALREADLAENFELRYQPFVDGTNSAICAAAAVVLWRNPAGELIPQVDFRDISKETGLASALNDWALRKACSDAALWPPQVKLAADLSPAQFAEGDLPETLAKVLASSGLPATRLVVRVTEACLADDDQARLAVLRALKTSGIAVTLADFGTGASSLRRLLTFPFDHIVIEETFAADATRNAGFAAIVSSMIEFAASRGIVTIAEEVTSPEQLELLRAAGCSQFRGGLFGSYRSAADLTATGWEPKVA